MASGGMLVGTTIEAFGKTNIVITGFVEAKYCEATPTTLKFTHETWDYVHKELEKTHPKKKIVGWIHTHPDFGIFLSEYDRFIHQNFFSEDSQVAFVVDPIRNTEGFYFWINEKLEKCKGFYLFDKTGKEITAAAEEPPAEQSGKPTVFRPSNVLIAALAVAVLLLTVSNISTSKKLETVEGQQQTLADSATQSLAYMQQQIIAQANEIKALKELLQQQADALPTESEERTESEEPPEGGGESESTIPPTETESSPPATEGAPSA